MRDLKDLVVERSNAIEERKKKKRERKIEGRVEVLKVSIICENQYNRENERNGEAANAGKY